MTNQHDDVPLLEEIVFPCNEIDEALSNNRQSDSSPISEAELKQHILQAVDKEMDSIIETAIFRTMQDSIAILAEEMKDEVKVHLQASIEDIVSKAFAKLK